MYLDYTLEEVSGEDYIIAEAKSDSKRKNAWIIVEDIYINDNDTDVKKHRRGDIVFVKPSE